MERAATKNTIPKLRKKASCDKGNVTFSAVVGLIGRDFIVNAYGSPESQQKYGRMVGELSQPILNESL